MICYALGNYDLVLAAFNWPSLADVELLAHPFGIFMVLRNLCEKLGVPPWLAILVAIAGFALFIFLNQKTWRSRSASSTSISTHSPPPSTAGHVLIIGSRRWQLGMGAELQTGDLPGCDARNTGSTVAQVVTNPQNPSILGLKNLSRQAWSARLATGEVRDIDPGKSIQIADGTAINFGSCQGSIENFTGATGNHSGSNSGPVPTAAPATNWLFVVPFVVVGLLAFGIIRGCPSSEQRALEQLTQDFNTHRQQLFNAIHPRGTAKSVVVHEVIPISAAGGQQQFGVRVTIFWSGLVTQDGFTKLFLTYDSELNRWIGVEVLETNGVTNADVAQGMGEFAIGFLKGYFDAVSNQQNSR